MAVPHTKIKWGFKSFYSGEGSICLVLCSLSPVFSINTQEWDYFWDSFGTNCVISYTCRPSKISVLTFSKLAAYSCCTVVIYPLEMYAWHFQNQLHWFNDEQIVWICSIWSSFFWLVAWILLRVLYVTGAWTPAEGRFFKDLVFNLVHLWLAF